mmetsp:Transcript_501/g.1617  ORF Transcript_501/g.1617 Transcript_501/m.1617 type:complete len:261 (+) Transcript_501:928-1710(+)
MTRALWCSSSATSSLWRPWTGTRASWFTPRTTASLRRPSRGLASRLKTRGWLTASDCRSCQRTWALQRCSLSRCSTTAMGASLSSVATASTSSTHPRLSATRPLALRSTLLGPRRGQGTMPSESRSPRSRLLRTSRSTRTSRPLSLLRRACLEATASRSRARTVWCSMTGQRAPLCARSMSCRPQCTGMKAGLSASLSATRPATSSVTTRKPWPQPLRPTPCPPRRASRAPSNCSTSLQTPCRLDSGSGTASCSRTPRTV